MTVRINSDFINTFNCVSAANLIPIFLDNNPNKVLGDCNISNQEDHSYADLTFFKGVNFNDEVGLDMYVYFYTSINAEGWCEIENIGLHTKKRSDKDTKTLRELIV
jgi:hypothetical protein